jgi:hypothetical protein
MLLDNVGTRHHQPLGLGINALDDTLHAFVLAGNDFDRITLLDLCHGSTPLSLHRRPRIPMRDLDGIGLPFYEVLLQCFRR